MVGYASRVLQASEKNYSISHLEALAVIFALKKFRYMILGYNITIYTDHSPLKSLFHSKEMSGRLARWAAIVQEFNPKIEYLPGKANKVADALSRQPLQVTYIQNEAAVQGSPPFQEIKIKEWKERQKGDALWSKVREALEGSNMALMPKLPVDSNAFYLNHDGVLVREVRLSGTHLPNRVVVQVVVPDVLIPDILRQIHGGPIAGHPGCQRSITHAKLHYLFKNGPGY